MENYRPGWNRMMLFFGWNVSMSQAINPLPWLVQAQGLFAQRISFGGVWRSSNAFAAIRQPCRSSATPMIVHEVIEGVIIRLRRSGR